MSAGRPPPYLSSHKRDRLFASTTAFLSRQSRGVGIYPSLAIPKLWRVEFVSFSK